MTRRTMYSYTHVRGVFSSFFRGGDDDAAITYNPIDASNQSHGTASASVVNPSFIHTSFPVIIVIYMATRVREDVQ